ncbi:MAG: cation:proton antiporter [Bacteroidetes bacterium]|nr:cation:proton antiporter [Rhodothermia bacterium]MCS7155741.1 cation:proton antiporter [Bacteroidota bacterium]MCX7906158.1 cation:proton antiporter [Bacteroidota bacterium]MDW8138286.1 cation:proton antiporter [Bacteroidota bacterium]MDW8285970.1 cation:proton antiporter [Bacteroidota bacterium]
MLLLFLVQIGVILSVSRLLGWAFRRLHQPQVVGEMLAGLLLGPSLLGNLAPGFWGWLFPPSHMGLLHGASQLGLVLFMFLIGLEVDPRLLRQTQRAAVRVAQAGIVVPFALGGLLGWGLHGVFAPEGVPRWVFALFMAVAMSITAFPVLARILSERNLLHSPVGVISIVAAGIKDVVGWLMLALMLALVRPGQWGLAALALLGVLAYAVALLGPGRRLLERLICWYRLRGQVSQDILAVVLGLVLFSSILTEGIGVHALFGAFLLGLAMPKDPSFVREIGQRIEDLVTVLLLPLFFAYTGLRTDLSLLLDGSVWVYGLLVFAVAIAGKFGACAGIARLMGLDGRAAWAIGALMNTRGLMELVILNIGLDLGVISRELFTLMALMAIATTLMATPLLQLLYPARARHLEPQPEIR